MVVANNIHEIKMNVLKQGAPGAPVIKSLRNVDGNRVILLAAEKYHKED